MEQKKRLRRAFWCGTFLVVAAATGVYWAADFCKRHPDLAWIGYAVQVAPWAQGVDPGLRVGQPLVGPDHNPGPAPACAPGVLDGPCHEPALVSGQGPHAPPPELIDLTALPQAWARPTSPSEPDSEFSLLTTAGHRGTDPDEEVLRVMPPCLEDARDLPDTMPYAVDLAEPGLRSLSCYSERISAPTKRGHSPFGDAEEQEPRTEPLESWASPVGAAKPVTLGNPPMSYPVVPWQPLVPPIIDTTEFRPSDARKGEFDKSPL